MRALTELLSSICPGKELTVAPLYVKKGSVRCFFTGDNEFFRKRLTIIIIMIASASRMNDENNAADTTLIIDHRWSLDVQAAEAAIVCGLSDRAVDETQK